MVRVKKEGVLLKKTELGFENEGVMNPGVFSEGGTTHILYRAVRKGNYSSIGYCRLDGPLNIVERHETPILFPQFDYESQGIEDPRVVKIDDTYFVSYTAYDNVNALGALATSKDLKHFEKHGIIVPRIKYVDFKHLAECQGKVHEKYFRINRQYDSIVKFDEIIFVWDKNIIFYPRKIDGQICFLHRIKPGIQLVKINALSDLTKEFWDDYFLHFNEHILMDPHFEHEASYIGGGCPPIETEAGWLLIYHGVHDAPDGFIYSACAALFDLDNPSKEIARLPYPLFQPEFDYEKSGEVNNVCFPTGHAIYDDTLYIYYGAADEQIAVASVQMPELINELLANRK
jgi:beta-1,2-mannobiose phosphorylase / 1,2-beta-oligomannan phosphorylase